MSAELGWKAKGEEATERRNWLMQVVMRRVGMVDDFWVGKTTGPLVQVWYRQRPAAVRPAIVEVEHEVVRGVYLLADPVEGPGR